MRCHPGRMRAAACNIEAYCALSTATRRNTLKLIIGRHLAGLMASTGRGGYSVLRTPRHVYFASVRVCRFPSQIASAREEGRQRKMSSSSAQAEARGFDQPALLVRRVEQARKPGERHSDGAGFGQFGPHRVCVKAVGEMLMLCS